MEPSASTSARMGSAHAGRVGLVQDLMRATSDLHRNPRHAWGVCRGPHTGRMGSAKSSVRCA
eukprot:8348323-Pyramimonas_sp.AAC.1